MLPLFLLEDLAMPIVYEPHPVSPERKKELRDKGLKIVDARFKPASEEEPARVPARKVGK